jgi:hypothetical protein
MSLYSHLSWLYFLTLNISEPYPKTTNGVLMDPMDGLWVKSNEYSEHDSKD